MEIQFVGPLNLNRHTKQAYTVMGTELSLTPCEFNALEVLAANENKPVALSALCTAAWSSIETEGTPSIQLNIDSLVKKVNNTGEGFMWIEISGAGYTFHTRWGHNWKTSKPSPYAAIQETLITQQKIWHKKALKTIVSGALTLAASVTLVVLLMQNPPETDMQVIPDSPVPLAASPETSEVFNISDTDALTTSYDANTIPVQMYAAAISAQALAPPTKSKLY